MLTQGEMSASEKKAALQVIRKTNVFGNSKSYDPIINKLEEKQHEYYQRKVMLIKKIKAWLEHEVKENNKYTYDDYNDFDDLDVYLFRGRSECASGLLNQIEKWENEPSDELEIVRCKNGVGEWEISPLHETFDTREQAEKRLKEIERRMNND